MGPVLISVVRSTASVAAPVASKVVAFCIKEVKTGVATLPLLDTGRVNCFCTPATAVVGVMLPAVSSGVATQDLVPVTVTSVLQSEATGVQVNGLQMVLAAPQVTTLQEAVTVTSADLLALPPAPVQVTV